MNLNRRTIGTGLAVVATMVGLSQCPNKKPTPSKAPSSQTSATSPDKVVRETFSRFFEEPEEGPTVDMIPYLDENGDLKRDFNPLAAVGDCIRNNSANFGATGYDGSSLFFPERIENNPDGAFPIKLLSDGNSWNQAYEDRDAIEMTIVSGSGRQNYSFALDDLEDSTKTVKEACKDGLEKLEESHSADDFCDEIETTGISGDIMCRLVTERWTSYAEMGQTLKVENNDFSSTLEDLGFDVNTSPTGSLELGDGYDDFKVYRHNVDDPSGEATWIMGYEVEHKSQVEEDGIPITYVITFKTEEGALEYIADPDAWKAARRASQGW